MQGDEYDPLILDRKKRLTFLLVEFKLALLGPRPMDSDVHVWYTWLYWQNWAAGTELAAKIAIGSSREIAPLSKVRDCKSMAAVGLWHST